MGVMRTEHRNNHYVPQWYQERFIPTEQADRELFYRDLAPAPFRDAKGRPHEWSGVRRQGPRKCFSEPDLYTRYLGDRPLTEIEKFFFGKIDTEGKRAVDVVTDYSLSKFSPAAFQNLLTYMGTQKLRTPKGLGWIAEQAKSESRDEILRLMIENRRMYAAIWSECVWLVADASQSETKFILSDHPVTVYNRRCGPSSKWCRGFNDPEVVFNATQTVFPLSLNKVLLLTNLSWARNPYQDPTTPRPNSALGRGGYFKAMDVQTERHLTEREVLEINFIIKSRAHKFMEPPPVSRSGCV